MTPISVAVAGIVKVYGRNPAAMSTALEALVTTHIETRDRRTAKELAEATCHTKPKHATEKVICLGCYDEALEKLNGQ